jgi:hypothetical protein
MGLVRTVLSSSVQEDSRIAYKTTDAHGDVRDVWTLLYNL